MDRTDITIIGAGVIGLAAACKLAGKGRDITVIEKNRSFGQETSSRNSEVIHAGLYYPKGSLKSKLCIEGKAKLYDLCRRSAIPYKRVGKLVIATNDDEEKKITAIFRNALDCGAGDVRLLSDTELRALEPDLSAKAGFFSPDTGIIDTHTLMEYFYKTSRSGGVNFSFSVEVIGIKKERGLYEVSVKEPQGETFSFMTKNVVNCAGLSSGKVAAMPGLDAEKYGYNIHLVKGQYYRIRAPKKFRISHLVYPPPTDSGLGIHITPDLAGGLRLGPDAHYTEVIDYNVDPGAQKDFFDSVKVYLPKLTNEDLMMDTAGVRPKLHGPDKKFADFVIRNEHDRGFANFINTVGIESPGLTSCLAIADMVNDLILP